MSAIQLLSPQICALRVKRKRTCLQTWLRRRRIVLPSITTCHKLPWRYSKLNLTKSRKCILSLTCTQYRTKLSQRRRLQRRERLTRRANGLSFRVRRRQAAATCSTRPQRFPISSSYMIRPRLWPHHRAWRLTLCIMLERWPHRTHEALKSQFYR